MLRNNTERSHDEHERYDQSIEKNREGNTRIPDGMQTQESNHKNDTDG